MLLLGVSRLKLGGQTAPKATSAIGLRDCAHAVVFMVISGHALGHLSKLELALLGRPEFVIIGLNAAVALYFTGEFRHLSIFSGRSRFLLLLIHGFNNRPSDHNILRACPSCGCIPYRMIRGRESICL